MSSPKELVQAAGRHVRSQVTLGRYNMKDACARQLPRLLEQVRSLEGLIQAHLTELNEYLEAERGTFSGEERTEISAVAEQCFEVANASKVDTPTEEGFQKHYHMQHWYPDWLWSIIMSTDTMSAKLQQTAEFWIEQLGLRDPDEKTKRLGVAICEAASSTPIDPQQSYDRVHELAGYIRTKKTVIPGTQTVRNFQKDPKSFMAKYPNAYAKDHPPVKCRIDEKKIRERNNKEIIPCRDSNKKVRTKRTSSEVGAQSQIQPASSASGSGTLDAMKMMMEFMFGSRQTAPKLELKPPTGQCQNASAPSGLATVGQPRFEEVAETNVASTKPENAGGLPGCLQPPSTSQESSAAKMARLRENIKKAAASTKAAGGASADGDAADDPTKDKADDAPPAAATTAKHTAKGTVQKKPGAKGAPKPAPKEKAPKGKTSPTVAWYDDKDKLKILNKKAKTKRPKFAPTPVKHLGGKIHFSKARKALRVDKRKQDKVETNVALKSESAADKARAYNYACALIETDPRPHE